MGHDRRLARVVGVGWLNRRERQESTSLGAMCGPRARAPQVDEAASVHMYTTNHLYKALNAALRSSDRGKIKDLRLLQQLRAGHLPLTSAPILLAGTLLLLLLSAAYYYYSPPRAAPEFIKCWPTMTNIARCWPTMLVDCGPNLGPASTQHVADVGPQSLASATTKKMPGVRSASDRCWDQFDQTLAKLARSLADRPSAARKRRNVQGKVLRRYVLYPYRRR